MRGLGLVLVQAMVIFGASPGLAQTYPAQTVRIVVPFPPGGAADILARGIGQKFTESFSQQFIIDNRPGAGATLGPEVAAKAAPDGYTLLLGSITNHAVAATLYPRAGYDLEKSFAPIGLIANAPHVLVVHPTLPVRSVKEVIALAKARPGELLFASLGSGTLAHLEIELLQNLAKIKFTHVPYKGSAPAKTDLVAGHVQLLFDSVASSGSLVQAGKLKALAVASGTRSTLMPELPTLLETGVAGFQADNWYGLLAPAAVPKIVIERLGGELPKVLAMQDVRQRFNSQGMDVTPGDAAKLAVTIRSDLKQWTPIVRQSGAKVE